MLKRKLYSIDEVAEMMGDVSRSTVYNLVRSGNLAAVKLGRSTRITSESVEGFIAGLTPAHLKAPEARAIEIQPRHVVRMEPIEDLTDAEVDSIISGYSAERAIQYDDLGQPVPDDRH